MPRDDFTAAPNAQLVQHVVYGIDPRGAGIFAALTRSVSRPLVTQRAVVARPTFGGIAQAPQKFTGAAGLGVARPAKTTTPEMSDQVSKTLADPIRAAFLAREQ